MSHFVRGMGVICLAACMLGIVGCGGVSPRSSFYRLEGPTNQNMALEKRDDLSVGIGPVGLPGYLDRPEIVTGDSDRGIQINEFHRWAAPLGRQVREALMENLSILLHTPKVVLYPWERAMAPRFRVDVTVLRFEHRGNKAVLEALWHIKDVENDRPCLTRKFIHAAPVAGTDVGGYVAAQGSSVAMMGKDIARALLIAASGCQAPGQ